MNDDSKQPETDAKPMNDITAPPDPSQASDAAKEQKAEEVAMDNESAIPVKQAPEEAAPAPEETIAPEPVEAPASSTPEEPMLEPTETPEMPAATEPEASTAEPTAEPSQEKPAAEAPMTPHEHRNTTKFIVMIIVVAALIICGVAVFMFMSTSDNAEEAVSSTPTTETTTTEQQPVVQPDPVTLATPESVQTTTDEVDQALEALDDTEFSESDLSDESLEL